MQWSSGWSAWSIWSSWCMLIMITMVMVTETIILTIKTMSIYLWLLLAMPSQVGPTNRNDHHDNINMFWHCHPDGTKMWSWITMSGQRQKCKSANTSKSNEIQICAESNIHKVVARVSSEWQETRVNKTDTNQRVFVGEKDKKYTNTKWNKN